MISCIYYFIRQLYIALTMGTKGWSYSRLDADITVDIEYAKVENFVICVSLHFLVARNCCSYYRNSQSQETGNQ